MKKLFTLLTSLLLLGGGNLWAETGTETNPSSSTKNADLTCTSFKIPGTYIPSGSGSKKGTMSNNGLKLRTNQNSNTLEFVVTSPYEITGLELDGYANDAGIDATLPGIKVTKVTVDGEEVSFTGGEFPVSGAGTSAKLTVSGISAKTSIVFTFDNSNVTKTSQIVVSWSVDYKFEATEPASTTVTPAAKVVAVGKTTTLTGTFAPSAGFEGEWVSDNTSVATVVDGVVTGVSAGVANITYQWKQDQSKDAFKATAVITVVEPFDPSTLTLLKSYDFGSMGETTLTIGSEEVGAIWNKANKTNNKVFACTNEGLENLAIQAAYDSNKKGWKIDDTGLLEGSGAGRCAAICGIKTGWIVEFVHDSGEEFYTDGSVDDGIDKTIRLEESNHHVFKALEDGMIGFELTAGKHITNINIYSEEDVVAVNPAKEYTTYVTTKALDFTGLDLKAYVAISSTTNSVTLEEVTKVPAGTALVLKKGDETLYAVPVAASASAPAVNLLKGSATESYTVANNGDAYVLSDGAFHPVNAGTLATGKAYILKTDVPSTSAPFLNLTFGETTGISATLNHKEQIIKDTFFNLNGQRVAQPNKGLYIMNGRKVVVK